MRLRYPEQVLVVDECGDNTNMKRDKKAGNEKYVVARGDRAQISCASDDCHFTTMCYTNLLGIPVLVVVIIAKSSSLLFSEKNGLDLSAEWIGSDIDKDANMGPGRRYPGGPVCSVLGKEVPAFVTNSERGGITPEILAATLAKMDELVSFPRSEGVPPPFVLLDGHSSRFQPQFLKYITDPRHTWEVCLGLPNGTHVWQVGDSKQQNGSFKRLLILAKRSLIQEKQDNQEQSKIGKVDIIPLVSKAFSGSFSNVQGNTHAISERGWNPLNQNCLKDPEVLATKVAKKVATAGTEEQASTETSTSDIVRKP
jgi:hypothetical protein